MRKKINFSLKNGIVGFEQSVKTNIRLLEEIDKRVESLAEFESEKLTKEKEKAESLKALKETMKNFEPMEEQQLTYAEILPGKIDDFFNSAMSHIDDGDKSSLDPQVKFLKNEILEFLLKKHHTINHHKT